MIDTAGLSARILVADDQSDIRESLRLLLKSEGVQGDTAGTPAAALAAVDAEPPDLVLIDMNYGRDTTSGGEGLELLERLQKAAPTVPVVIMTAWGSIELAVEAMPPGAKDFIQKPWGNVRLLATLRTQLELSTAVRRSFRLEAENALLRGEGLPALVARSRAMQPVLNLIHVRPLRRHRPHRRARTAPARASSPASCTRPRPALRAPSSP